MKAKKLTAALLTGAMVFTMAACGSKPAPSAPSSTPSAPSSTPSTSAPAPAAGYDSLDAVELIAGDATGKGAAGQIFGQLVASKVDEITGGKLTIDYHPNSELGGDVDLLRQVQSGDLDIVVCQTAPMVSFIPEMAVFDLPMVFSKYDADVIDKVLNGADSEFNQQLGAAYEKAGYHLLGFLQNGTYRLTTANIPLNTLADFKALQIRTMENKNHMDFWTAIGASPTPLAWPEVYISLQNGTIDAQENAADTCATSNLNEVQKYLACTNHILYNNQICINADSYNNLDPLFQEALNQAVTEAIAEMRPQLEQIDVDNKAKLEQGGMTIINYEASFYDEILNLDGVKALYSAIDGQIGGLGTTLQGALDAA